MGERRYAALGHQSGDHAAWGGAVLGLRSVRSVVRCGRLKPGTHCWVLVAAAVVRGLGGSNMRGTE